MSDDERIALALAALAEVADPQSVGALVDASVPVPGVIDLRFATTMPGYAGWFWTVSTSALEGVEPTVLELELLPGDGALVAPAWVPWEERLAEWRRVHPGDDTADDEDEDDLDEDVDGDETDLDDALDDDVLELDDDGLDDAVLDSAGLESEHPGTEQPEPARTQGDASDDEVTGDLDDPQERTV